MSVKNCVFCGEVFPANRKQKLCENCIELKKSSKIKNLISPDGKRRFCYNCLQVYEINDKNVCVCPTCANFIRPHKTNVKPKTLKNNKPKLTLDETLNKLNEYNSLHNTSLSYGKFISMLNTR